MKDIRRLRKMIIKEAEMTDSQVKLIADTIGAGNKILEIGAYAGKNTISMAAKNLVVVVDPFVTGYDRTDALWNQDMQDAFILFRERTANNPNVLFFMIPSKTFLGISSNMFDAIVIDGDHSLLGISIDIEFRNYVKPGGYLIFHDYSDAFQGVKQIVDKYIIPNPDFAVAGKDDSLVIFRRIK